MSLFTLIELNFLVALNNFYDWAIILCYWSNHKLCGIPIVARKRGGERDKIIDKKGEKEEKKEERK